MSFRALLFTLLLVNIPSLGAPQNPAPSNDDACAACHKQIYDSYQQTLMANASGKASDGLVTGDFTHQASGVHYRVFNKDGRTWMSYERTGDATINGQRELLYYIGSGRKGRSYLFSKEGFLFESPINWYSQEGRWNMAPAYTEAREIPMNLPARRDCLNCHASGVQSPMPGTENRYDGRPFLHGGVSCERCHGQGTAHAEGNGPILNPAKLAPERRDAVCMQCHFEATVAIQQPGKHLYDFRPGDELSDYVHYFLLTGPATDSVEAVSQTEALALSVCKLKSGDRMSCTSCHDPHFEPADADKAAYFRGKCLACHGEAFGAKHHADKTDCTECHMPKLASKDVAHTQATDHQILRRRRLQIGQPQDADSSRRLIAFPAALRGKETDRDLGLAWEDLAQHGVEGASHQAEHYLRLAVNERPDDTVALTALAYIEQEHRKTRDAQELYERVLQINPLANRAATDLGVLEAGEGNLRRAAELWRSAFDRAPHRSLIGIDLAITFCEAGHVDVARGYIQRVLEFNPDSAEARSLAKNLNADPVRCKL